MVSTTVHLIQKQAKLTPDKTAVNFNDSVLSYVELNTRANQLASFLTSNGAGKGTVVAVALERSQEIVVTLLAIFKSGAAYVPLDPDYPNQRLEYMLDDSKAQWLITNDHFKNELCTDINCVGIESLWPKLDTYPETFESSVTDDDLAYILYTSGSTGMPKGVMIRHRNLLNLLLSIQKFPGLTESDNLLSLTTISFDISVLELFLPLTVGATLFITSSEVSKDGEAILKIIKDKKITFIQATPSTYKMMLAAEWEDRCDMKVICCGEQLPIDLAKKILSRCVKLYNMYGPTETTIYSTGKEILNTDPIITIGKPIDNTQVFILDDQQQRVQDGEIGEICIGGAGLAKGYFGKTELTDQKFFHFTGYDDREIKLYRTGDLGKILPDGEIQCFGRIDHQIKIRGYRIEVGEIEHALTRQPEIKEAIVTSWNGPNGDPRIAAYVVPETRLSPEEFDALVGKWRSQAKEMLPFYMVPNDFIMVETFPLLENGKVNRQKLPSPSIKNLQPSSDAVPTSDTELLIAKIWADNLGIEYVGLNDNFFDLGGHSLAAVKVIVQIKKETGKYLPIGSLFKNPTIAELSRTVEMGNAKSNFESLVPLKPEGDKAPLYIVHGLGSTVFKFYDFAHKLDKNQPVYGFQAKGIDGLEKPIATIEAMASQYVRELLKHNPSGPYLLSGYSLGGNIAFEMTRQLESQGKKVSLLAMFDSFVVKNDQLPDGLYKDIHKVATRIAKFFYTFSLLSAHPMRTINHKVFTVKRSIKTFFGQSVGNEIGLDENFDHIGNVMAMHRIAISNYKLKKLDREIHLFKAKKPATYLNDFEFLGWAPYVTKVNVHPIDGDHTEIFDDTVNDLFAKSLQKVIDDAKF